MRRFATAAVIILAFYAFTGCSETSRVNDKRYLRAVSIEDGESKKAVFAFYTEDGTVVHAEGDTVEEVGEAAELQCGKEIFTGHTELVILSGGNYRETLEFLLNEWKVSPSCLVAYGGENCTEILKNNDVEGLADSVRTAAEQGKAPECDIITVISGLLGGKASAEVVSLDADGVDGVYTIK